GKCAPITMQGLATAGEKPRCQEQWRAMEKTIRRAMETVGNPKPAQKTSPAANGRRAQIEVTSISAIRQAARGSKAIVKASPMSTAARHHSFSLFRREPPARHVERERG